MLRTLRKSNIKNKVVILRLDLNVPVFNNKILSDFRIIKSIPTIEYLLKTPDPITKHHQNPTCHSPSNMPDISYKSD